MFSECSSGFKCGIRTCQMLLIGHKAQRDLSDYPEFTGSCKFLEGRGHLNLSQDSTGINQRSRPVSFLALELRMEAGSGQMYWDYSERRLERN